MPRRYSFANPDYEPQNTAALKAFSWTHMPDQEVASQIAFQQQLLHFLEYQLDNLVHGDVDNPGRAPLRLDLSLRAGLVKAFALAAASITEGALSELGAKCNLGSAEDLHRRTLGSLLGCFDRDAAEEIAPIREQLGAILQYRNYVHLGRAAKEKEESYWRDILNNEQSIRDACRQTITFLSSKFS